MENQRENFYELKKNLTGSFKTFLLCSKVNYYSGKWLIKANKGLEVEKNNMKLLEAVYNAQ